MALHVTSQRLPNGMDVETLSRDGLAKCWVTVNLHPHSEETLKMRLWSRAVYRGAFYFTHRCEALL